MSPKKKKEKVQKIAHLIKLGKKPKRWWKTAVIIQEERTTNLNSLRRIRDSLQQGHLLHQYIYVKSIYLHDTKRGLPDKVMEGDPGWVLQGLLSRASFSRRPLSGQKTFTVLSIKRRISKKLILTIRAIMTGQPIDLVAGDFNGTAWRCSNRNNIGTIEEAFADCALPTPPGPTALWRPGSIPNNWADVCGFLKPPDSDRYWKVRMRGAFSIPRRTLGLRPTKAAIMRHGSTWISSIGAIPKHITKNLTDEFYSKSVLRHIIKGSKQGASAIS